MPPLFVAALALAAPPDLAIVTNFPGGSGVVETLDSAERVVALHPTVHKDRGWVCWWSVKLTGVRPGETITLKVTGNDGFARPDRAAVSADGKTWSQTAPGKTEGKTITYPVTV